MAIEHPEEAESVSVELTEFAAKCLQLVDGVASGGAEVVIMKDGHPVSRLVPCEASPPPSAARNSMKSGAYKGRIQILGDIASPPDDIDWDKWADDQVETFYKDLGK